ncbi:hypothetical protein [Rhizobium phage RHph_X2_24]|nr:hypothetical protein [Rhizobium phage RHph_X2_24]
MSDEYNAECRQFVENIRNLLGMGFGIGHQTSDMLRIIKATREYMLRLEQQTIAQRNALQEIAAKANTAMFPDIEVQK